MLVKQCTMTMIFVFPYINHTHIDIHLSRCTHTHMYLHLAQPTGCYFLPKQRVIMYTAPAGETWHSYTLQ